MKRKKEKWLEGSPWSLLFSGLVCLFCLFTSYHVYNRDGGQSVAIGINMILSMMNAIAFFSKVDKKRELALMLRWFLLEGLGVALAIVLGFSLKSIFNLEVNYLVNASGGILYSLLLVIIAIDARRYYVKRKNRNLQTNN